MKRADGFTTFPVSAHCWQPLWWRMSLTQVLSDQAVTSPPGLAWCRSSIRAGARTGSAVSANKVIVIYVACLLLARRPAKVAAIALANKLPRMAWAMMAKGERYRNPVALAA